MVNALVPLPINNLLSNVVHYEAQLRQHITAQSAPRSPASAARRDSGRASPSELLRRDCLGSDFHPHRFPAIDVDLAVQRLILRRRTATLSPVRSRSQMSRQH
jgi:hypothetical protein